MPTEFPMKDAQNIWQNQPTEAFKMSAEELRHKAQQRQRKARIEALYSMAIGLALSVFFARAFTKTHDVLSQVGWLLLSLWAIYFAYQAYRWMWPRGLQTDATVGTSLAFNRSELEKRRDYRHNLWRRAGLKFCLLGVVMVAVPALNTEPNTSRLVLGAAPVVVLLAL